MLEVANYGCIVALVSMLLILVKNIFSRWKHKKRIEDNSAGAYLFVFLKFFLNKTLELANYGNINALLDILLILL